MKLSTRSRYASRAIVEIAMHPSDKPVNRKTISDNQNISSSYLENILIVLKNQGIIKTIRGPKGGYILAKDPADITMLDIVNTFEGNISAVSCSEDPGTCERNEICPTKIVWDELQKAQEKVLNHFTIEKLVEINNQNQGLNFSI